MKTMSGLESVPIWNYDRTGINTVTLLQAGYVVQTEQYHIEYHPFINFKPRNFSNNLVLVYALSFYND